MNHERIQRYKKAFPEDERSEEKILNELNRIKNEKKSIDKFIILMRKGKKS